MLSRMIRRLVLLQIVLLVGCSEAIVTSEHLDAVPPPNEHESVTAVYSLPKSLVAVTLKTTPGTPAAVPADPARPGTPAIATYSVTQAILPDKNARFRLRYRPTSLSDDSVTFGVDGNGLLSSVVANETGHQGDIIVALASAAATAVAIGTVPAAGVAPGPGPLVGPCTPTASTNAPQNFTVTYELQDIAAPSCVALPNGAVMSTDWTPANPPPSSAKLDCLHSVCYRTLMPMKVTITDTTQTYKVAFVAVDPELTEGLDLFSAPLVSRTHTATFSSGLLTSAVLSDPSVALAVAQLPLTVVKAILAAPAAVFSAQSANRQDQLAILTAQKAILDEQVALQKDRVTNNGISGVVGSGAGL